MKSFVRVFLALNLVAPSLAARAEEKHLKVPTLDRFFERGGRVETPEGQPLAPDQVDTSRALVIRPGDGERRVLIEPADGSVKVTVLNDKNEAVMTKAVRSTTNSKSLLDSKIFEELFAGKYKVVGAALAFGTCYTLPGLCAIAGLVTLTYILLHEARQGDAKNADQAAVPAQP